MEFGAQVLQASLTPSLKEVILSYFLNLLYILMLYIAIELADNFSEGMPIEKVMDSKEKEIYEQLQGLFEDFINTDPSEMDYKSMCNSVKNLVD
jgi:hypothetical protein